MEILTPLLGTIGGTIAGFFTSYYFWNKERKKDKPRIIVDASVLKDDGRVTFFIQNTGFTHAEKITVSDLRNKKIISKFDELKEDQSKEIVFLEIDEAQEIVIKFFDVWGKKYESEWRLEGPQQIEYGVENGEDYGSFFLPFSITKKSNLSEIS